MRKQNKSSEKEHSNLSFSDIEKIHPHKMLLYLSAIGSSLVFLFMIIAFAVSRTSTTFYDEIAMPRAFVVSIILLLLSSFTVYRILPAFSGDNMKEVRSMLGFTLALGITFALCQYIGWLELAQQGIYLSGEVSGAYLYVISGLHALHVLGAISYVAILLFQVNRAVQDPVKGLIMFTSPYQRIKLEMLTVFWHYIDVLWIILFIYFLFTFE